MVKCPLCPNPLRPYLGNLVRSVRGHRFYVNWGVETERTIILAAIPKENVDYKAGSQFPVPDDQEFEDHTEG